jgi:hypothetical protein
MKLNDTTLKSSRELGINRDAWFFCHCEVWLFLGGGVNVDGV